MKKVIIIVAIIIMVLEMCPNVFADNYKVKFPCDIEMFDTMDAVKKKIDDESLWTQPGKTVINYKPKDGKVAGYNKSTIAFFLLKKMARWF